MGGFARFGAILAKRRRREEANSEKTSPIRKQKAKKTKKRRRREKSQRQRKGKSQRQRKGEHEKTKNEVRCATVNTHLSARKRKNFCQNDRRTNSFPRKTGVPDDFFERKGQNFAPPPKYIPIKLAKHAHFTRIATHFLNKRPKSRGGKFDSRRGTALGFLLRIDPVACFRAFLPRFKSPWLGSGACFGRSNLRLHGIG